MDQNESPKSNIPEFSVGELAFSLKRTLEENFARVRVRGELSRVSIAGSGHMYSSLKDDQAVIDAVCWKGTMSKLTIRPEEGMEVICTGRISTYPSRSNYQLIIESMELAGEGALLKLLEERRKKLAAEGLFDAAHKRPLPALPRVIGVVTSPTGAVIRDILHRLEDRFPVHVIVWPVLVQGEGAARQITDAINGFQTLEQHGLPRPDLLIVARGGGSLEDLMPFNDEAVVRAAAASQIPLISAVGHETDTTLIDYAADLRAPTPTGAAEKAVPVRAELLAQVLDDEKRLLHAITRLLAENRHRLEAQARGLSDPGKLLEIKTQRLDHAVHRLEALFTNALARKRQRLTEAASGLVHPRSLIEREAQRLARWREQLETQMPRILRDAEHALGKASQLLEAYSYDNVLQRGFTVLRADDGSILTRPDTALRAGSVQIEFSGRKTLKAQITDSPARAGASKKSFAAKRPAHHKQDRLF